MLLGRSRGGMLVEGEPIGPFVAVMTERDDAPGVVTSLALYMRTHFGGMAAVLGSAGAHLLFRDALPMFEPGATAFAGPGRISVYDFYFHSQEDTE